ncbi:MAG: hypothetical protein AB2L21_01025 [Anaerolineaceae bacterium]
MKTHMSVVGIFYLVLVLVLSLTFHPVQADSPVTQSDIIGPPGSVSFGESVTVLSNGNFVVTDPDFNSSRGAVYLYNPQGSLISLLTGSLMNNSVGSGGIVPLTNGNYLVLSPLWDSDQDAVGAVTWCSQETGCNGAVSATNSLIGSSRGDQIGSGGGTALLNGNYVVSSPNWNNGNVLHVGAVTWGNGATGTVGKVSAANSLVGNTLEDKVGSNYSAGVTPLTNGNYLVGTPTWDNGAAEDAGALTWGNGLGGTVGVVSASNSLVGSTKKDNVGDTFWDQIVELTNGNFVVSTTHWDLDATHPDAGAITWGSGTSGVAGQISADNSLVGTTDSEVIALANGNYVVSSPNWSPDETQTNFGAVTWGSGTSGVAGQISAANSLVGTQAGEYIGEEVIALTNGNYVINSPDWGPQAGAVTWGNGAVGIKGTISEANSLVGHSLVGVGGGGVIALTNGNYVVSSPAWYEEAGELTNIGAVTWGNGTTGIVGKVSAANSLVGIETSDAVGDGGLVPLTNGNYVVITTNLYNGSSIGTVTWVDGSHTAIDQISAANSLVGSTADDEVGSGLYGGGVTALSNGNYIVHSPYWDNGAITDAGAITWGNGTSGTIGVVSAENSLVGSTANDQIGKNLLNVGGITLLTNGNYVVSIPQWDNGAAEDAGAVTWGNGMGGTIGPVSAANSLVGSTASDLVGNGSNIAWGPRGVTALSDGDYVVTSSQWSGAGGVGAITRGDGSNGTSGVVSASNSLVNTSADEQTFNNSTLDVLADGNAAMHFPDWTDGIKHGAISLLRCGEALFVGPVSMDNSVFGIAESGINQMVSDYDSVRSQLIVGRPKDNTVTIFSCTGIATYQTNIPMILR